jgi:hypothetical protein
MRLLSEDIEILKEKFPGVIEFIKEAELRYLVFRNAARMRNKSIDISNIDPGDKALTEKWFVKKMSSEGLSVTTRPKKINME